MSWHRFNSWPIGVHMLVWSVLPLGMPFALDFEEGEVALAPGVDVESIARRVDGVQTAQEMVAGLIALGTGSSAPSSVALADDLTVVALRAEDVPSAVNSPADARDGRALVAPGAGSQLRW